MRSTEAEIWAAGYEDGGIGASFNERILLGRYTETLLEPVVVVPIKTVFCDLATLLVRKEAKNIKKIDLLKPTGIFTIIPYSAFYPSGVLTIRRIVDRDHLDV